MKIGKKDCHFKKDTAICDSFEMNCIEGTSLHAYLICFTRSRFLGNVKKISENTISRIFTSINSKENM